MTNAGDTMRIARLRLRIRDKATNATYAGVYPWTDGFALCWVTGTSRPLPVGESGYTRYNDRGEPEPDSWREGERVSFVELPPAT